MRTVISHAAWTFIYLKKKSASSKKVNLKSTAIYLAPAAVPLYFYFPLRGWHIVVGIITVTNFS